MSNQGSAQGQLANRLRPLGDGLAALAQGLGAALARHRRRRDVRIRPHRARERRPRHRSRPRQCDLGRRRQVSGGQVYGEWPGLAAAQLYQGRDLAVTTDFRAVLAAILGRHMGLADRQLDLVFPGAPPAAPGLARLLTV